MASEVDEVRAAVDQWFAALNSMVAGNPEPFAQIYSHADDVLYLSGEGTYRVGYAAAFADWKEQAAKSRGGHVRGEDVRIVVSGDLAAVANIAHATVTGPDGREKQLRVRHSHVFRRENGAWKMIMHHADDIPVWEAIVQA
jgi:uncharacterized protein (TIGR02246 family)